MYRATMGHLRVTIGHLRVTVGHPRVIMGHLRLTIGYLEANTTELHPKVRQTCSMFEFIQPTFLFRHHVQFKL